jgi:hypothetical protein
MSSLSAKDRVSLCMFSFADGRRCRTPRLRNHPHFCYDHAEKEARARAKQSLGTDLARYFSGEYLSACDLSTALGCLIPAVVRGDVKPRTARTVAYMAQTLLQSIHISQHEYCEAFSPDAWRKSIRNSVNSNHNYRFPPHRSAGLQAGVPPQPQPAAPTSPACHPERSEGSQPVPSTQQSPAAQAACPEGTRRVRPEASRPASPPQPHPPQTPINSPSERNKESAFSSSPAAPQTQPQQPAPPPRNPLPPTAAEFAQQVLARHNLSQPDRARSVRPGETAGEQNSQSAPAAHPSCPDGTRRVRDEVLPSPIPAPTPPTQASPVSTPSAPSATGNTPPIPAPQPEKPPRPTPQPTYNWQTGELHFDHTCRLRIDGKLV